MSNNLTVRSAGVGSRQFWVESEWSPDNSVAFSGFFGSRGPHVFAAAPDLLAFVRDIANINPVFVKGDEKKRIADARALVAKAEGRS